LILINYLFLATIIFVLKIVCYCLYTLEKMSVRKQYTDAEKAAYYRKKAQKQQYAKAPRKPVGIPKSPVKKSRAQAVVKKPGMLSNAGTGLGSAIGSGFGPVGTAVGGFLGGKLGHLIETVTGFGDYTVEKNTVLSGGMPVPEVRNSLNKGGVIVRHREYIGDIAATSAFTVQKFILNPGLQETFPWLSQMANSFEQYKLHGVLFEFVSTSSDALLSSATSTALGSVMMSTDYDVADIPPPDKRTMLNAEFSSSAKPSCSFIHPIECERKQSAQNILYTRGAAVPDGYDPRLYDFANFYIATEGMQAASGNIGELWVTYEIEFLKQQFYYAGLADHYRMTAITGSRPLGTVSGSNIASGGTIGGLIAGDALSYAFPPLMGSGKFLMTYAVKATNAAMSTTIPTITFTNAVGLSVLQNDTVNQMGVPENATSTVRWGITCVLQLTGQGAYINFSTGNLPDGTAAGDFWVVRLPDSITTLP